MKNPIDIRIVKTAIALWYLIGIAGFMIPRTRQIFEQLTPVGMLMATAVLWCFHEPKNRKNIFIFSGIVLFGFAVELVGVNTGTIFGHYAYGKTLGPKLFSTPLVIGFNWFSLIYCISALASPLRKTFYFPVLGATVMVIFDWLMEPVAIALNMWHWALDIIPYKNYIAWFMISAFIFQMIKSLNVEIKNQVAGFLLAMQFVFFLVLNILIHL